MILEPWIQYVLGQFTVVKNPWGLSSEEQNTAQLQTFITEATLTEPFPELRIDFDFTDIEYDTSKVKAFPQFTYGDKDSELPQPEGFQLPALAKGQNVMQFIAANYVLSMGVKPKSSGQCNIASEIFLYPADTVKPIRYERLYEIMMWIDSPEDQTISKGVQFHQGEGYKVYRKAGNRTYMAFVLDPDFLADRTNTTQVNLQWSKILRTAYELSLNTEQLDPISDTYKAFSIETGLEIWAGKGSATFVYPRVESKRTDNNQLVVIGDLPEKPGGVGGGGGMAQLQLVTPDADYRALHALQYSWCALNEALEDTEDLRSVQAITLASEKTRLMHAHINLLQLEANRMMDQLKQVKDDLELGENNGRS